MACEATPPTVASKQRDCLGPVHQAGIYVVVAPLGVRDVIALNSADQLGKLFVIIGAAVWGMQRPHAWIRAQEFEPHETAIPHGPGEEVLGQIFRRVAFDKRLNGIPQ